MVGLVGPTFVSQFRSTFEKIRSSRNTVEVEWAWRWAWSEGPVGQDLSVVESVIGKRDRGVGVVGMVVGVVSDVDRP